MSPQQISNLIRNRRSVFPKNYSEEKVENEVILEMLENANWAPTHRLTEPWRFVIFEGDGLKKFAEYQSNFYKLKAQKEGNFDPEKYRKLQTKPLACSHIIAIGLHRDPDETVPEIEEIAAVSCAVQNMWLTAAAYGIGCYWSTGGVTYEKEAREFFSLNEKDILMGFMMIGKAKHIPNEGKRRPLKDKITWINK